MKVQAQSEGGLAIRWAGAKSELWGTTASAKMDEEGAEDVKLLPTSTYNLKKWTYAKAKTASVKDADTDTWDDITADVMGEDGATYQEGNGYVVMQPFEIRSTSSANQADGLFVSGVTITRTATKDIDAALRVGVHLYNAAEEGDGVFYIYGPDANATKSYTWSSGADKGVTTKSVALASYGTTKDSNSAIVAKGTAISDSTDTPIKVEIYIWYEGEDAKLYSDNYDANDLNISVSFSSYGFA